MGRASIWAAIATLVAAGVTATAQAPTRITVTFKEVRIGDSANDVRLAMIDVTLFGGNQIGDLDRRFRIDGKRAASRKSELVAEEHGTRRSGRSVRNKITFDTDFQPFEGRSTFARWGLGPNNTLVRRLDRGSDIETIILALPQANLCRATVIYRLVPGHRAYNRNGGRDRYRGVRAEDVSCSVSD